MDMKVEQSGDVTIVAINDRFEAATADEYRTTMYDLAEKGHLKVVLDFGKTAFIDSSALGSLVSSVRKFRQHEGDIKFACMNEQVRPLVKIVRLHRIFDIFDSVDTAVSSFS